ncbi:rhodanese domain protein [Acinetobacter seifertii]|nr:rhodanese domain protein [Acinetobacter seifertii]
MIRKQEITTFEFPENAVIWDVRDSSAYAEGHVKGAISRPINDLNADILSQVAADQPIYILCGGGSKAPRAAEKLEDLDASREYVVLMGGDACSS